MIAVQHNPAAGAPIGSLRQRHLLPMAALAAILAGVGRVHGNELTTSICCFVRQKRAELRPRRVTDAFGKAVVMHHSVDIQVFHRDNLEPIDDLPTVLMCKIPAPIGNTLMHMGDGLPKFSSSRRAFRFLAHLPLDVSKVAFILAEEARVIDGFPGRQRSEGRQSNINAHGWFWCTRNDGIGHFAGEGHEPLAGAAAPNTARLDRSLDRPVQNQAYLADLGEAYHVPVERKAGLRVAEGVVAVAPTEAGKARILACLEPTKEGFERQVNPHGHILQDLAMHIGKRRTQCLEQGQTPRLIVVCEGAAAALVHDAPLLQQQVVQPPTLIKLALHGGFLCLRRSQSVLKGGFVHDFSVAQRAATIHSHA